MTKIPYFSIITVCYNSEETIQATLRSVSSQKFTDYEHLIIDGGSQDATLDAIQELQTSLTKVISEPDGGIYDAINKGLKLSLGEVVVILHSDDSFADQDVLHDLHKIFLETDADIVYSSIEFIRPDNTSAATWVPTNFQHGDYRSGFHTPHPGFFAKSILYDKLGFFDLGMPIAADFDLMYRFMEHSSTKSVKLDKITVNMRADGESSSLRNIFQGFLDIRRALKKQGENVFLPIYYLRRYAPKIGRKFKTG
ncbi:glycosyltransferase family 2 protein [Cognatishimia sp. SS12]|uniref:glycosyltransferase family 2 protein n=1 Tax=Cognatishimia sp. SS12 TaxID=2979465 RepID=UPI00232F6E30|nr:glycosyltransferase family 2 protein [Cognatishimia sp. SS12]MDC0739709.1 glycosyltransferase family 2 protein [Cognatishimia sp. SS12]